MWTGSIKSLSCVNITVPSFDVNPTLFLKERHFFCQNLSNIYSNNIGNTQNRNPPKRLWAFEDVPFHVIYLHEIKLRNWSAFYSWQGRQWIGWLTQDDKSSKFSCKVKSPLKRNRRTWMEWHRGIAKKHGLSLAHWDINPTEFLTRSDTFFFPILPPAPIFLLS